MSDVLNDNFIDVEDIEFVGDKALAFFKDEKKQLNIYYGVQGLIANDNVETVNTDNYIYKPEQRFSLKPKDSESSKDYVGELITFRNDSWAAGKEFIKDLFKSIYRGLVDDVWSNLKSALDSLSEILEVKDEEELRNVAKGYVGEICFMYWMMKKTSLSFFKIVFNAYQKKENKKHDFKVANLERSKNLDIEIKSTQSENRSYIMKANQQEDNMSDILFYGFVKYDILPEGFGKTVAAMLNEIFDYLNLSKESKGIPNHLIMSLEKFSFDSLYVDTEKIEVDILSNSQLPNFFEVTNKASIDQIKYKLNLPEYVKTISPKYNREDELKQLEELVVNK